MSTEQEGKYMRDLTLFVTFSGPENVTEWVKPLMYFLSCSVLIVYDIPPEGVQKETNGMKWVKHNLTH